jgi:hypothetical protein
LQVLEQDLAPEWLRKSWATAKEAGLGQLSMDEVDAEIAAARKGRRASAGHLIRIIISEQTVAPRILTCTVK